MAAPLVIVLMGVAGCGKSTTGAALSKALGWPFRDADSFHPPANIDKMSRGLPLDDEDRGPWLAAIARLDRRALRAGRARHRLVLGAEARLSPAHHRRAARRAARLSQGRQALIGRRLAARKDHFMPAACSRASSRRWRSRARTSARWSSRVAMSPRRVVAHHPRAAGARAPPRRRPDMAAGGTFGEFLKDQLRAARPRHDAAHVQRRRHLLRRRDLRAGVCATRSTSRSTTATAPPSRRRAQQPFTYDGKGRTIAAALLARARAPVRRSRRDGGLGAGRAWRRRGGRRRRRSRRRRDAERPSPRLTGRGSG